MKIISVQAGKEITSSNINKSLDERIAEGEKELDTVLSESKRRWKSYVYAESDSEKKRLKREVDATLLKEDLLIKQLSILEGMKDGNIVHVPPNHSRRTAKCFHRAWSKDPVFDYLLKCNHLAFQVRGWKEHNKETENRDDDINGFNKFKLLVILDF